MKRDWRVYIYRQSSVKTETAPEPPKYAAHMSKIAIWNNDLSFLADIFIVKLSDMRAAAL